MEVPLDVVMVTCAVEACGSGGTVTEHAFWEGQLVGATCPLKVATIWPVELRKLAPLTPMA